jgi:hypothetical protein
LQSEAISFSGLNALFLTASNLLPIGFAAIVATVANGLLSADMKARLVFCRWTHALPGHRAFSLYGPADPRVDMAKLKRACGSKIPDDPVEQNRAWYRLYKAVENAPAIAQVHRDFLLTRDYAGLAAIFMFTFGPTALITVPTWRVSLLYCLGLALQFLIVRHAALTYGIHLTKTVLAEASAGVRGKDG